MNENEILLLYYALKDKLQKMLYANDPVQLTLTALLATKDLHRFYNLKNEQLEKGSDK